MSGSLTKLRQRCVAAQQSPDWTVPVYSTHTIFVLVAPSVFAASIYMCLGRIIRITDGERHSLIRAKWLTKIFVIGDVISFLMQGAGKNFHRREGARGRSRKSLTIAPCRRRYHGQWNSRGDGNRREHHHRRPCRPDPLLLLLRRRGRFVPHSPLARTHRQEHANGRIVAEQLAVIVRRQRPHLDQMRFPSDRVCAR